MNDSRWDLQDNYSVTILRKEKVMNIVITFSIY